ncbi:hypothetical protein DRE_06230 [Drechslerella stenobrocha 248]|uniref:Mitochondrial import inner membrane translocase subunit TIM50 n=1 Tax=Drechslerella stenobrocha 248 TaxID=1043628 RepID=W7HM81_9PEZI|nr:hypothetical protein DRE_06230 [Drechslerella stenobrocha 248]
MNEPIVDNSAPGGGGGDKRRKRNRRRNKSEQQQQAGKQELGQDAQVDSTIETPSVQSLSAVENHPQTRESPPDTPPLLPLDAEDSPGGVPLPPNFNTQQPGADGPPPLSATPQPPPRYWMRKHFVDKPRGLAPSSLSSGKIPDSVAQGAQARQYRTLSLSPSRPKVGSSDLAQSVLDDLRKLCLPADQVRQAHWEGRGSVKKGRGTDAPKRANQVVFAKPKYALDSTEQSSSKLERLSAGSQSRVRFGNAGHRPAGPNGRNSEEPEIQLEAPEPTLEYLEATEEPAKRLDSPEKRELLIILDLNGTLFYRERSGNGRKIVHQSHPRPWISKFFEYIFREHKVVFFSSAMQGTVLTLLNGILREEYRPQVLRIFTREDMDIPEEFFRCKVSTFKRLDMVWDSLRLHHHSWDFGQHNTILIDDSERKAASEPYNHVLVPEYTSELKIAGKDAVLKRVSGYIEEARGWDNVSAYVRANPFNPAMEYPQPAGWDDEDRGLPTPVRRVARVGPEETRKFHERYQMDVNSGIAKPYSVRKTISERDALEQQRNYAEGFDPRIE